MKPCVNSRHIEIEIESLLTKSAFDVQLLSVLRCHELVYWQDPFFPPRTVTVTWPPCDFKRVMPLCAQKGSRRWQHVTSFMLHTDILNKKECFFLSIGMDLCHSCCIMVQLLLIVMQTSCTFTLPRKHWRMWRTTVNKLCWQRQVWP